MINLVIVPRRPLERRRGTPHSDVGASLYLYIRRITLKNLYPKNEKRREIARKGTWEMKKHNEFNQIRAERERAGLTLKALSEKTGIPLSTLDRYQDKDSVPLHALQKIADALNLPISALTTKREIPEGDKLSYDQVSLQLQATQQHNVYLAMICDGQKKTNRLLRIIAGLLFLFLAYILVDRFGFPNAGIFHAG